MGRDEDGESEVGSDASHQREHVVALDRVEAVGRLVEQDQLRVVHQRLGQLDPLALAGRHRADGTEPLLAKADLEQDLARAHHRRAMRDAPHLSEVADQLARLNVGWKPVVLGRVADPLAQLVAGFQWVHPEHLELARVGPQHAQEQADQGRLARAVRAEQTGDSLLKLEGHVAQREHVAELALDVVGSRDRRHCRGSLARPGVIDSSRCA